MSGQMLYGYCSLGHMFSARYGPTKLPLKFYFEGGQEGRKQLVLCVGGGWLARYLS